MASGDVCAEVLEIIQPAWMYVKFTSGSVEPTPGDLLYGDTSNATGYLELLVLTSGSWAGSDAAGWMFLSNITGTFTSAENWTKNTTTPANDGTFTLLPASCYAVFDTANDIPEYRYDDAANEVILFLCRRHNNSATGGITVRLVLKGAANTGDMAFGGAFRSFTDDTDNFLVTAFNAWGTVVYNSAIDAPSVVGEPTYDTIAFSDGAEVDNVAADELFLFLLFRNAQDTVNDDMSGDASLVGGVQFVLT